MEVRGMEKEEEEARAEVDIWNYVFGYAKMAVVKCAIELGIADVIESHGIPMPLSELTTVLRCEPSRLHRIMRFLVHHRIFKEEPINQDSVGFSLTPMSRRLIKHGEKSMAALIMLQCSPSMLAPLHSLSARVLLESWDNSPFDGENGLDLWSYAEANPTHNKLFNEGMACDARQAVQAIIEGCPQVFDEGIESLVDVGGGNATALSLLVKAFPRIRGIIYDLPHVVDVSPKFDGIEKVGGDMFISVPNADAIFLMWILHDWNDEECIKILKNCREAISKEKGKVIIVEAVLEEEEDKEDELASARLMLDICIMGHTNKGKERTLKEWRYVLRQSGFTRFNVKPIRTIQSVIEAYPLKISMDHH